MIAAIPVARLFRTREEGGDRVAFVELFFDLVFVFAVTQLSHHVIEHLTPLGVLEGVVMLVAVWWLWIYTTWVTNWMNPQKGPVRWMLITMMLGGLVLSTAIPEAFGDRAAQFAIAYLVMQVGRTVFVAISYAVCDDRTNAMNLVRIALWFVLSAPFWIAGALLGGEAQLPLWAAALAVELLGPAFRYWMPRLGVSPPETWQVAGGHMAERAGLFMIIALGESIIITGTLFSRSELTTPSVLAFLAAFVSTILFWLLYFSHGAEHGARFIQASRNTGIIARLTYTYLHMVLVAGIVLVAVGDELVLAHPDDPIDGTTLVIVLAAPALYLLGNLLFKRSIGRPWLRSHLLGMAALTAMYLLAPLIPGLTALAVTWIANGVLALVVLIDELVWPHEEEAVSDEEEAEFDLEGFDRRDAEEQGASGVGQ
ncbi:low temperature requirement protein A [Microcella daejeonensis]|uniref:Low temperature requirement protein A n=1 Tax=Microcella daejeonensis TaxID=2994971 RepID=A0A9E8SA58_9MICO|nr:low temperature requirement protein A [Microcella daejeonensis]WAB80332.1 low temperature requirement protein A [Microcella daejeonensis]